MSESVGKISLDLEVQSDINSQVSDMAQAIGQQMKNTVSNMAKSTFDNVKKEAKSSMQEVLKMVQSTMDQAAKSSKDSMESMVDNMAASTKRSMGDIGKGLINSVRKAMGMVKSAKGSINPIQDNASLPKSNVVSADTARGPPAGDSSQVIALQTQIENTKQKAEQLRQELEQMGNTKVPTQEYMELEKSIEKAESKLLNLLNRQEKMEETGVKKNSSAWKGLQYDIQTAETKLKNYEAAMSNLNGSGQASASGVDTAGFAQKQAQYEGLNNKIGEYSARLMDVRAKEESASSSTSKFSGVLGGLNQACSTVTSGAGKLGSSFKSLVGWIGNHATSGIKKLGSSFKSIIGWMSRSATQSKKTGSSFGGLGNSSKSLGKSIMSLGNMFKMMLVRMAMRAAINGAKEGFQNLAQYSSDVNRSISSVMSALTQLKNSLATAFAPILNVVAPILTKFINMLSQAATYVGMFFASLTGQSSFTKAVGVTEDYAAGLSGVADSATNAADKAKEAAKAIGSIGIDELNTLSKDDSDSDSSSGSGGTSGGGTSPSDMFETVSIDGWANDLSSKIKEAWANADFTEIGSMVGNKLNEALASIDWVKIQATLDKIAKSTATFLNGFISATDWGLVGETLAQGINTIFRTANTFAVNFNWSGLGDAVGTGINGALNGLDWAAIKTSVCNVVKGITESLNSFLHTTDWGLVGKTLAQGINTIVDGAYTFVTTFDWGGLGSSLASGINSAVYNIDWSKAGKTLSDGVKGIIKSLKTAIGETDWYQIGKSIGDFLAAIDWAGIIKDLAFVIGQAIGGLTLLLWGVIEDCVKSIGDFFSQKIEECGGNIVLGLLKGILDGVIGIATWLYDNLVAPIIDGVKSMFGIHSPSTVFAEIGGYIIEGLINGIIALRDGVVELFQYIWDKICEVFGSVADWFGEKFTLAKEAVTGAFESIGDWFSEKYESIKEVFNSVGIWFKDKFTGAYNKIKGVFDGIGTWFSGRWTDIKNVFTAIPTWFKTKFTEAYDKIKGVFDGIGGYFGDIWDTIKSKFTDIGQKVGDAIGGAFKAAINAVLSTAENVLNTPINVINDLINKIKSNPVLSSLLGGLGTLSTFSLPRLAQGGYVKPNTPQLAMIGDNMHQGEVVAPENKMIDMINTALKMQKESESGGTSTEFQNALLELISEIVKILKALNLDVYLDGRQLDNAITAAKKRKGFGF